MRQPPWACDLLSAHAVGLSVRRCLPGAGKRLNAEAMQLHLDDIAAKVAPLAHAILIFDQAGWHGAKSLNLICRPTSR